MTENSVHVVPAVVKTIKILECFSRSDKCSWTIGELCDLLHVPKSSVYRILNTLEAAGIVEKEEGGNRYYLGPTLARWAENYLPHGRYREVMRPYLEELNCATKEAVQLATMQGHRAVVIDKVDSAHMVRAVAWIGRRSPLHCSALGKALLSKVSPAFLEEYLSARLEKITPLSVTDPQIIRQMIQEVREKGYAVDKGELEEGLWCFGIPISLGDSVHLAISVSGPAQRMVKKRELVIQLFREIQQEVQCTFEGQDRSTQRWTAKRSRLGIRI